MTARRLELPQGTLDLLVLKTLAISPQHGWGIAEHIQRVSDRALQVHQGTLYPALHRLERKGWIRARWGTSANNRRAKFYDLTKRGLRQLELQADTWRRLTVAVGRVLDPPASS
jgi:transcriptional regulator